VARTDVFLYGNHAIGCILFDPGGYHDDLKGASTAYCAGRLCFLPAHIAHIHYDTYEVYVF